MRKAITWLLTVAMILSVAIVPVSAASMTIKAEAVGDVDLAAGTTFDVDVTIEGNPGIVVTAFTVDWDKTALKMTDFKFGSLLPNNGSASIGDGDTGTYAAVFGNDTVATNYEGDGTLATMTFEILDTATAGTKNFSLSYVVDEYDTMNVDMDLVEVTFVNGSVNLVGAHVHDADPAYTPMVPATCTSTGTEAYYTCTGCGKLFKDAACTQAIEAPVTIPMTEHTWDGGTETTPATCSAEGVMTYECTVCHTTKTEPIDKLAHTPEDIPAVPATCTSTGLTAGVKCSVCGEIITAQDIVPMIEHTWDGGTETTPATCSAEGVMTYECTVCHTTKTEPIDKLAHTPEDIPAVAPTCTEAGKTAGVKCSVCGEIITAPTDVDALGHDWDAGVVTTPATETEDGVMTYTCNRCGVTKTEVIPKLVCDHATLTPTAAVEATCTAEGNIAYWTCDNCGRIFSDAEATTEITLAETVIEKIAHTPAEAVKENEVAATCTAEGSYDEVVYCSVCGTEISRTAKTVEKTAHTWGEWTVTKEATYDEEGSREHTCSVCGTKETEVIPKKTHSSGKDKDTTPAVELVTYKDQFKDVSKDDYFYEPVKWAFEKEITAGVTEDLFGVGQGCTRAHVVTFLWAAAGKNEVSTEIPFTDVAKDAYYAKAVAWAYSKGITAGTSVDAFSPDVTITRAQAITMLWVYMGCPEAAEAATFTDVPADAYYAKAVAWALEKGVTAGKTATTFAPNDTCTREQIVTFLAIGSN